MNLFYHIHCEEARRVELDAADAIHLTKVLRHKSGAVIHITNGKGDLFEGQVLVSGKTVEIDILTKSRSEPQTSKLELIIAPTKNQDRIEWFVEKAVEIGICKIRLITTEHSERSHIRIDRLHRVAIAAMKQSLKLYLPEILVPLPFAEVLPLVVGNRFIAHCRETPARQLLQNVLIFGESTTIAIGPEGDFSISEINMAVESGFVAVSLGNSRLRTETAAMCAVHTVELINQRS